MKDIAKSFVDMLNLVMADAYTYKVITKSETLQIPVASREHHVGGIVDTGVESDSITAPSMAGMSATKSATPRCSC